MDDVNNQEPVKKSNSLVKIVIIIVIFVLLVIGVGIYFWLSGDDEGNGNKEILRNNIEDYYYQFVNLKSCEEKSYLGFADKESCQSAMRCTSIELSKMIKLEDLNQLVDDMQGGINTSIAIRTYLYKNNIKTEYDLKALDCFSNNGYDTETYQCRDGACLFVQ